MVASEVVVHDELRARLVPNHFGPNPTPNESDLPLKACQPRTPVRQVKVKVSGRRARQAGRAISGGRRSCGDSSRSVCELQTEPQRTPRRKFEYEYRSAEYE